MSAVPASPAPCGPLAPLHAAFLAILPRIEEHGRLYFRHVRCPHRKAELLAELRGLAWKWHVRLARRGKDVLQFVSALATYAARAANTGRRVYGHERVNEVLSPVAQRKRGFSALRADDTQSGDRGQARRRRCARRRSARPRPG